MTDRLNSLTVVLENDVREDDADSLMIAIQQFHGVLSVEGNVTDITLRVAQQRVRHQLESKLLAVLRDVPNE